MQKFFTTLGLLGFVLTPQFLHAFTFGSVVSAHSTTYASTLTLSNVSCSADDVLVVSISYNGSHVTTSVTYNSNTITEGQTYTNGSTAEVFYSLTPSVGTHDVVISLSASRPINAGAVCISGADTSAIGATGFKNGSSNNPNTDIITTVDGSVVIDSLYWNNYNTAKNSQDGTQLFHQDTTYDGEAGYSQYKEYATAGSQNLNWQMAGSEIWVTSAIEILPLAVETPPEEASTTPIDWGSATTTNRMLGSLNFGVTILITLAILGFCGYVWNYFNKRKKPWQR